ncbi:copper chaperone PCu(A)C [Sphingorhabdus contaminans]|uniref:copper chaperone PCu(A)C n=1 Tax=Sphingorhabdus contaminans TaxID=1343899 RepID=UPI003D2B16E8
MLELLTAILKASAYLAALSGAGTVLARHTLGRALLALPALAILIRLSGLVLALAASGAMLVYTLRLAETLDADNVRAVLLSPLGAALGLQLIGGLWLAVAASRPLALVGSIAILASFGVTGHSAARGVLPAATLVLHISAAAWWLGGLWALLVASRTMPREPFAPLVRKFSQQALWIVSLLVAAAIITAVQLLGYQIDWTRDYDFGLIAKAALTFGLLGLAAVNRTSLSKRLAESPSALNWLRGTIIVEILLFLAIFATTAWLTTWHSPHEQDHRQVQASGPIQIVDPWAPATIGTLSTGAGYLTIINTTPRDDRLLSASSPWAEDVTLHVSTSDGRMTRMEKLEAPTIPAGGELKFSPGANHLMLNGLYSPLVAGDSVPVTLKLERGGEITIMLRVLPLGERPSGHHEH